MAVSFVAASPTAYVASGASSLTVARPAGTAPGDIMLACVFARFGHFVTTDPAGRSSGSFFAFADDGTRWVTRAGYQTLLYRVVRVGEPTSYTFPFQNTTPPEVYGNVTESYIVGAIVAYRGADIASPVGADDLLTYYGSGEPVILHQSGHPWDGSLVAYGHQFDGFAGADGSAETPFFSPYWYAAVQDQLAIIVVSIDWYGGVEDGMALAMPDPPTGVDITLPPGFTRRSGGDSPHGGLVTIADGVAFSDPAYGSPGTLVPAEGTWRGKTFDIYDAARYRLASSTLDTPDQEVDGIGFSMQALIWVMAVYAGEVAVEDGCPPRLAASAHTGTARVRVH